MTVWLTFEFAAIVILAVAIYVALRQIGAMLIRLALTRRAGGARAAYRESLAGASTASMRASRHAAYAVCVCLRACLFAGFSAHGARRRSHWEGKRDLFVYDDEDSPAEPKPVNVRIWPMNRFGRNWISRLCPMAL